MPESALTVVAVPAFTDNYLWLVCRGTSAVVVDPGDAAAIEAALQTRGLLLSAIVLTHHHRDHTGGVAELLRARPGLPVYGPHRENIVGITQALADGERVTLADISLTLEVIDVPGHTSGHIAYFGTADDGRHLLFCGDTLFAGGCGRLFEGTPAQMQASLARLAALPGDTLVYCAHEYTLANLRFALAVEPANAALQQRQVDASALRAAGKATVPSNIALERATNPFLRWEAPDVRAAAERLEAGAAASPVTTFAALRAWKDRF